VTVAGINILLDVSLLNLSKRFIKEEEKYYFTQSATSLLRAIDVNGIENWLTLVFKSVRDETWQV